MKPTQEQILQWAREAGLSVDEDGEILEGDGWHTQTIFVQKAMTLAYEAGRKDENEACASLEVHLITPTRDYTIMSPLDCYEAALMDEAMAFRAAIRARREQ